MRLPAALACAALLAVLVLGGCGSSDEGTTIDPGALPEAEKESKPGDSEARTAPGVSPENLSPRVRGCRSNVTSNRGLVATGVGCAVAKAVAAGWSGDPGCAPPKEVSRSSCTVEGFRCLSISASRGTAVSCSRPEQSVVFIAIPR